MYSQRKKPNIQHEILSPKEVPILDKTSITSVVDFIRKYQSDATFAPPSVDVSFDSDNYSLDIDDDSDVPSLFDDVLDYDIDELRDATRAKDDATRKEDSV